MSFVRGSNSALSSSIFFFFIFVLNVKALLCGAFQLFPIKLLQLLHSVFVDRVHHV